jgi:putative ATPase
VSALLSRTKVYALRALSVAEIIGLLERALPVLGVTAAPELLEQIAIYSSGDARTAYNILDLASSAARDGRIEQDAVEAVVDRKVLLYDKSGEEHFNLISALHKSVRSSDPDAALYWLARMLEGGEDRMYIARRLVRMAIEDIGLADPRALEQAVAAQQAAHFLGTPEGDQALAQIAIYLAVAPKSDAAYKALGQAQSLVQKSTAEPVPMQLRNAPTKAMKSWGYGEGYEHAHGFEEALNTMECLPDSLKGTIFYQPTSRGLEERISNRLKEIREARRAEKQPGTEPK